MADILGHAGKFWQSVCSSLSLRQGRTCSRIALSDCSPT
jgi:hypothetical protein